MMSMRRFLSTACPLGLLGVTAACGLWARSLAEAAERPPTPPPASAAKQPPKDTAPKELAEDDGKASGRRSIAGGGHAVRFTAPDDTATLKQVKVHGSRYGLPRPPREDFVVFVCDEKFQKLAEFPFRYERFERGEPRWVTLDVKPFRLPRTFYIGLDFDPTQTKGVYVSHDGSRPGKSVVGLPGERVEPFEKGNWMIRAVVADH